MTYRPSESRYDEGGRVVYLQYASSVRSRSGNPSDRVRVKRVYLPGDSWDLTLDGPKTVRKRTGRRVHGVALQYKHRLAGATAKRGDTEYRLRERVSERTKVIELPQDVHDLRLLDKPPKGLVGVA
jgi:hypothetical protein